MNIIFLGSDSFAVPSLKALIAGGYTILTVVTQPDRQKGRGLALSETPVKAVARAASISLFQPSKINAGEAVKFLKELNPDLLVVIAYGQLLSEEILAIPRLLPINLHASLLPKYRGAAPINRAMMRGEKNTGVTIMKITKKMDAGPIIMQEELNIAEKDSALTLEKKLAELGAKILLESLSLIETNQYKLTLQDESKASFALKLKKEDGLIDWNKPAPQLYNLVRGCLDWPGAFTYHKGKLLKIYKVKVNPLSRYPVIPLAGEVIKVEKNGIIVATKKDSLIIEELQIEGKRRMPAEEFISGHKISVGERLGKN